MSLAIYPAAVRGLTWPVMKTHEFSTPIQKSPNLYETRIANSQNPIWHWTLIYDYLKDNPQDVLAALSPYTDYRYLEGFLLSLQGQFSEFLFDDPTDDAIGALSQPGGTASFPSLFRTNTDYPGGSYVLGTNATPRYYLVAVGGRTGSSFPTFPTGGGSVTTGQVTLTDQGVWGGANAQVLPLVSDTTNPVSVAAVGSSAGSGFAIGDYLAVAGGGGTGAVLQVLTVSAGAIATFTIVSGGSGYSTTTGAALTVLTGAGTGAPTANITAVTVYYTPVQRNFGGQFLEDVTDLNTTNYPLSVWEGGTLKTGSGTDYTLRTGGLAIPGYSYDGDYLQWVSFPGSLPITALAQFYFRVRLESDQQDIEQFLQTVWTIGGTSGKNGSGFLKLMSSRVPAT